MKINRKTVNKIKDIIFYLHILNPVMLIILLLGLSYFITCSWWSYKRNKENRDYYDLKIDKDKFIEWQKNIMMICASLWYNTLWMNDVRTRAFVNILERKYFPYRKNSDKLNRYYYIQEVRRYIRIKNKI